MGGGGGEVTGQIDTCISLMCMILLSELELHG